MNYLLIVTLLIAVLVRGSTGECDHEVVSRIVQLWEGSPPSNVLAQMEGVFMYVWLSPEFMPSYNRVRCAAAILDPDLTTTTSVYLYNGTNDIYLHTYKKMENNGKITISYVVDRDLSRNPKLRILVHLYCTGKYIYNVHCNENVAPDLPDESQYVVSMEDGILTFYQCMHTDTSGRYKPFAGVAVSEKNLGTPLLDQHVENAKKRLSALGLGGGISFAPCDPDVIAIV